MATLAGGATCGRAALGGPRAPRGRCAARRHGRGWRGRRDAPCGRGEPRVLAATRQALQAERHRRVGRQGHRPCVGAVHGGTFNGSGAQAMPAVFAGKTARLTPAARAGPRAAKRVAGPGGHRRGRPPAAAHPPHQPQRHLQPARRCVPTTHPHARCRPAPPARAPRHALWAALPTPQATAASNWAAVAARFALGLRPCALVAASRPAALRCATSRRGAARARGRASARRRPAPIGDACAAPSAVSRLRVCAPKAHLARPRAATQPTQSSPGATPTWWPTSRSLSRKWWAAASSGARPPHAVLSRCLARF